MKLYRRPSPIVFLLLIPSFQHAYGLTAAQAGDISEGRDVGPVGPGAGSSSSIPAGMSTNSVPDSSGKTMDAPVDGKDGRPHAGPFVETNAERDRKKAKEIGDGMAATSKPTLKDISSKSASYADGRELPETNDGVMDDPNRTGPKEGTRGTEGGISEKNKGRMGQQGDSSGTKSENKPDPPKEAPPLPHSEQKIVVQNDPEKKGELDSIVKEEKSKSLGGLEVLSRIQNYQFQALNFCRNHQTSPKNLTTSLLLFRHPRRKPTTSKSPRRPLPQSHHQIPHLVL